MTFGSVTLTTAIRGSSITARQSSVVTSKPTRSAWARRSSLTSAAITSRGRTPRSGKCSSTRRYDEACTRPIQPMPITPMPMFRSPVT